jgi:hypothetical protein
MKLVRLWPALLVLAATPKLVPIEAAVIDPTCITSVAPTVFTGATLDTATPTREGVVWNGTDARLQLAFSGGDFRSTGFAVSEKLQLACSGDFDGDGWTDFIGAGPDSEPFIYLYFNDTRNSTCTCPGAVDCTGMTTQQVCDAAWNADPGYVRPPIFTKQTLAIETGRNALNTAWVPLGGGVLGCSDLNGDTRPDLVVARCATGNDCVPGQANVYLNNGVTVLNADPDGNPATDDAIRQVDFAAKYQFVTDRATVGRIAWSANAVGFFDYNKDGKMDMIWALNQPARVDILLNDGQAQPKFDTVIDAVTGVGPGNRDSSAVVVGDFTGDGTLDLVVGGVSLAGLRLYPGLEGGGFSRTCQTYDGTPTTCETFAITYQTLPSFAGGSTANLAADFSLDGNLDVVVGTDNNNGFAGGIVQVWENNHTASPFDAVAPQIIADRDAATPAPQLTTDLDLGFVFDYDRDPQSTPDFVMADGNNSGAYYVFANRVVPEYVDCGYVTSDIIDIGAVADLEMTITTVRIDPTVALSPHPLGGTVTWEASVDNGVTWVSAIACADDASEYCATFSTSVGKEIRWRAHLCTDSTRTETPGITGVDIEYSYVTATNHYRAGPIAGDGIIYVGAFRTPGDSGKLFAIADETGSTIWEAGSLLLTQSDRNLYTVSATNQRLDFEVASKSDPVFRATLLAPDEDTAEDIVDWQRSVRFGAVGDPAVLGAIENSTGALLTPPQAPYWYIYPQTTPAERTLIDEYLTEQQDRSRLLLVGAKDGALHAFRTNPEDPADPTNGTEAWAFIPFDVAQRLNVDRLAGQVQAYPDGAPTLISAKVAGEWRTILVSGEGNGGRSIYALDVTETIEEDGDVVGPTPLWSFSDPNMGRTYSKPAVIRVKVGGVEQWLVVFASGSGFGVDVGDTVYAVDLTTGGLVWRFDLNDTDTYIATDITAAETKDETGTAIDGYVDRLFFGDTKGRIWKLDPAAFTGSVIDSLGTIDVGLGHNALFSTLVTTNSLGAERAIAGTLAAAPDGSGRLVLFFGTGGTDATPNDVQNEFYAVYADTGEIRSKLGNAEGVAVGEKFYGGVVYNEGQLIFSSGSDLSGLGLCSPSAGEIVAIDANTFAIQFTIPVSSKIVAPLFARNGEIYTVTLRGEVVTTPYTGEPSSGGGGGGGSGGGTPGGGSGLGGGQTTDAFTVLGWRQVY